MIQNYIVVSVDNDEEQTFFDIVPAESAEEASLRIAAYREDYAIGFVDTMTAKEFLDMAIKLAETSVEEAEEWLQSREAERFCDAEPGEDEQQPDCDYEYPTI